MKGINKAYAISDAKISFVSLVDKAANKKQFLITKQEDGKANFTTYGRIIKADQTQHYITGIVYEPMVEDAHGNYMTEEEITKAAHWFAKNGDKVDLQHSFEGLDNVSVVETFVAKSDMEIEGEKIAKGTWVMTVEVPEGDIWKAVEKGEVTGFSMGGVGIYSEEDVDIEKSEEKGILKRLIERLGYEVVEKGAVKDKYTQRIKQSNFWTAYDVMESTLRKYDWSSDSYKYVEDEEEIRAALTDFNEIIVGLLASKSITKSLFDSAKEEPKTIEKAGKTLSNKNLDTLQGIRDSLATFLKDFEEVQATEPIKKEEEELKAEEIQGIVEKAVAAALAPIQKQVEEIAKEDGAGVDGEQADVGKPDEGQALTEESITKMVTAAVGVALDPIQKALEPVLKSRALPGNLNNLQEQVVEKNNEHYMTGIL